METCRFVHHRRKIGKGLEVKPLTLTVWYLALTIAGILAILSLKDS